MVKGSRRLLSRNRGLSFSLSSDVESGGVKLQTAEIHLDYRSLPILRVVHPPRTSTSIAPTYNYTTMTLKVSGGSYAKVAQR